jgi:hypothetical protein
MPQQLTIDPHAIDISIATSIDFQIHLTDYVKLFKDYANECAVCSRYRHTYAHSDPVTSQINFFKEMNSGELGIKDAPDGVKKRDVTDDALMNKNYRDQIPDNLQIKTSSGNKYGKPSVSGKNITTTATTTTRKWVSQSGDINNSQSVGKWEVETVTKETPKEITPVLDIQKTPPELDATYGMDKMTPAFKLWWFEKFLTAHEIVKRDLAAALGENNVYFKNFSESVGQLRNLDVVYDTSTLPLWDTELNTYDNYSTPNTIPGIAEFCVAPETTTLAKQLCKNTNISFRENMIGLRENASKDTLETNGVMAFPGMSHGGNLVTDTGHLARMGNSVDAVEDAIKDHLKGLYDVLDLLSNKENYKYVGKPVPIEMKVEKFTVQVDSLKNRVKSFDLDDMSRSSSRYGKRSTLNTNTKNAKILANPGIAE